MSKDADNKVLFKYKSNHDSLKCDCPDLEKCKPSTGKSFRIVHNDLNHSNNYKPPILITPRTFNNCHETCSGYALSFFDTPDNAEAHFIRVSGYSPKFVETVGNCIAECELKDTDGVVTKPSKKGHFDLHEYSTTTLTGRFKIIKIIPHEKSA
jgi:hypothetical protein